MMTDELISRLVVDLTPVSRYAVPARLTVGLAVGGAASALLVVAGLGVRPDLGAATASPEFWAKLIYALAMCAVGLWVAARAVRPAGEAFWRASLVLAPLAALGLAASVQTKLSEPAALNGLLFGASAATCPWLVVICSLAPLGGLLWAARGCAPTQITSAGAAIGLAAGGLGSALYSLHCTEPGMLFLGVWYTLGLAMVVAIGGLLGPSIRW
jgi:hypothetical protein